MRYFTNYEAEALAEMWVNMVVEGAKTLTYAELCTRCDVSLTEKQITKVTSYVDKVAKSIGDIEVVVGEQYDRETNCYDEVYGNVPCLCVVEVDDDCLVYSEDGIINYFDEIQGRAEYYRELAAEAQYEAYLLSR